MVKDGSAKQRATNRRSRRKFIGALAVGAIISVGLLTLLFFMFTSFESQGVPLYVSSPLRRVGGIITLAVGTVLLSIWTWWCALDFSRDSSGKIR